MRLSDKQALFTYLLGVFLHRVTRTVYSPELKKGDLRVRLRWVWDPPKKRGANRTVGGRSARTSLHPRGLAADIIVDRWNGKRWIYLRKTEDYRELGEQWKSLHRLCEWGGSDQRNDGNHLSLRHGKLW